MAKDRLPQGSGSIKVGGLKDFFKGGRFRYLVEGGDMGLLGNEKPNQGEGLFLEAEYKNFLSCEIHFNFAVTRTHFFSNPL